MRLIKLSGVPHPESDGGKSMPIYVDADRIVYIERSTAFMGNLAKRNAYNDNMSSFYDEVCRIEGALKQLQLQAMEIGIDNQVAARQWGEVSTAAGELRAAYSLTNSVKGPWEHPGVPCTTIGLALISDNGQQLSRLHVMESPDQIVGML